MIDIHVQSDGDPQVLADLIAATLHGVIAPETASSLAAVGKLVREHQEQAAEENHHDGRKSKKEGHYSAPLSAPFSAATVPSAFSAGFPMETVVLGFASATLTYKSQNPLTGEAGPSSSATLPASCP